MKSRILADQEITQRTRPALYVVRDERLPLPRAKLTREERLLAGIAIGLFALAVAVAGLAAVVNL